MFFEIKFGEECVGFFVLGLVGGGGWGWGGGGGIWGLRVLFRFFGSFKEFLRFVGWRVGIGEVSGEGGGQGGMFGSVEEGCEDGPGFKVGISKDILHFEVLNG